MQTWPADSVKECGCQGLSLSILHHKLGSAFILILFSVAFSLETMFGCFFERQVYRSIIFCSLFACYAFVNVAIAGVIGAHDVVPKIEVKAKVIMSSLVMQVVVRGGVEPL